MATPTQIDIFSRVMAAMYDEQDIISVPTTGLAFFGGPGSQTIFSPDSLVVDIDIIRGDERTAALIPRGIVTKTIGDSNPTLVVEKFSSFSRKFPLSEVEGAIGADQLLSRGAGENPYMTRTRRDRMIEKALKIHLDSVRKTVRMFNILATQSILTAKQDAIIGTADTDLQYDFRRNTNLTFTPGTKWDASGDILGDIDTMCSRIRQYGKVTANSMFMGVGAFNAMISDTTFQGLADNRRIEMMQVSINNPAPAIYQRFINSGWQARGMLRTPNGYTLWIFTTDERYDNSAGTSTRLMTTDTVLIGMVGARADRYFGPPERLPLLPSDVAEYVEMFGINPQAPPMPANLMNAAAVVDPMMFYCDAYRSADRKRVVIRTQSAPIFATTQTDAWGTITSVLT